MDAKQFLEEFGHIARALGGVQNLKDLILELAITGKLFPDQAGESEALLSEISKLRTKFVADGIMKRQSPLPEISDLDKPFDIPNHWCFERFGNVTEIIRGVTFPASQKQLTKSVDSVACLRTANIQNEVDWSNLIFVDPSYVKRDNQWVQSGDILISMANSYELVGKVALVKDIPQKTSFGGFIAAIRAHVIDSRFLFILLRSPYMQGNMCSTASQTTNIANISLKGMRPIIVPIPPLEEQSHIVTKVNELMVLCDKLEAQQQQKRRLQNHLRQSTLQALISAENSEELQEGWERLGGSFSHLFSDKSDVRNLRELIVDLAVRGLLSKTENGPKVLLDNSIFLDEVKKNKSGRRFAKMQKPKEVFKLPQGWIWVLLEDLLSGSDSGWSPKCDSEPRQGVEWGVLKVSSVTWGKFNHDENKRLPLSLEARKEHEVLGGDFLLSRANTAELVARSVIVPDSCPEKLMMSDKIVRLNFTDTCVRGWVNLVNNSSFARSYYREKATGTSDSMRNVSRQVIHELPIPFPPVGEQVLVLEKVRLLTQFCDSLEAKLTSANKTAERLATASIASLTGMTATQEEIPMKVPKTELKAPVRLGKNQPSGTTKAPLASLLSRHNGEMNANDLWQRFGGEIDTFYAQLKTEVSQGWITEPKGAEMLEREVD